MLMPSIFGENLFDDFFNDFCKTGSFYKFHKLYDEDRCKKKQKTVMNLISTFLDIRKKISKQS